MTNIKSVFIKGWSLISNGSQEENEISLMWIGVNVFAIGAFSLVKLSGV